MAQTVEFPRRAPDFMVKCVQCNEVYLIQPNSLADIAEQSGAGQVLIRESELPRTSADATTNHHKGRRARERQR